MELGWGKDFHFVKFIGNLFILGARFCLFIHLLIQFPSHLITYFLIYFLIHFLIGQTLLSLGFLFDTFGIQCVEVRFLIHYFQWDIQYSKLLEIILCLNIFQDQVFYVVLIFIIILLAFQLGVIVLATNHLQNQNQLFYHY